MATIPTAAIAPKKSKTGANFPKSQGAEGVRPARDRGENRAIPSTHCEATRKKFATGVGGY
jgi:hypothetical protein